MISVHSLPTVNITKQLSVYFAKYLSYNLIREMLHKHCCSTLITHPIGDPITHPSHHVQLIYIAQIVTASAGNNKFRDPSCDIASRLLSTFHGSFETGDARALDEDMREISGRSLDSQCMAARGPSISYRAALEVRVQLHECVRGSPATLLPANDCSVASILKFVVDTVRDDCATGFLLAVGSRGFAPIDRHRGSADHRAGEYSYTVLFEIARAPVPGAVRSPSLYFTRSTPT